MTSRRQATLLLLLLFVLSIGLPRAEAAPLSLRNPQLRQAEVTIGSVIRPGDLYVSFRVDAALDHYTFAAVLRDSNESVVPALESFHLLDGIYYARINTALISRGGPHSFSVQATPTELGRQAGYTASKELSSRSLTILADREAVGGAYLDIHAELFHFNSLGVGQRLYYRFSPGDNGVKTGYSWHDSDLGYGATQFDISALVNKEGTLEFVVGGSVEKYDRAATFYRINKPASLSFAQRPKLDLPGGYVAIGDSYYARIDNVGSELVYKRATDARMIAPVPGGYDEYGGILVVNSGSFYGLPSGFYYPVGPTATELHFALPAQYLSADNSYTAASLPAKLRIAAERKVPDPKINYDKSLLALRDGEMDIYVNNQWINISSRLPAGDICRYSSEEKGLVLTPFLGETIRLRLAAGERQPGSADIRVALLEAHDRFDTLPNLTDFIALRDEKLVVISGGYPLEYKDGSRWRNGLPRYKLGEELGSTEIRLQASSNKGVSRSVFMRADRNGELYVSQDGSSWSACPRPD